MFYFDAGTPLTAAVPSISGGSSLYVGSASPNGLISHMEGDDVYCARAATAPGYGPQGGGAAWWGLRRTTLAAYAQDDIKVTRQFTLNLGLRYEYASVPWEVGNRLALPADYGSLYGEFVVNPQPLWPSDRLGGNFGPRLGLAVDLGDKTVLRGGFGIFTNVIPTVYPDQSLVSFPIASVSYLNNAPYTLGAPAVSLPVMTSLSGQPVVPNGNTKLIAPNTPVDFNPFAAILSPIGGYYPSDRIRNGYTINGNFTLEHEFAGGIAVQASYVANNGVSLYYPVYPNGYDGAEPQYAPYSQITPGLTEVDMFYNGAYSSYNGLQVQVRKSSPSHGVQFQANYTWSKDMTDADDVWNSGWVDGGISQNNPFNCCTPWSGKLVRRN